MLRLTVLDPQGSFLAMNWLELRGTMPNKNMKSIKNIACYEAVKAKQPNPESQAAKSKAAAICNAQAKRGKKGKK
jgi:hypothetical protein